MPRDFETHWEKNPENYKHGWKFEPFQVKGNIAAHHEKTKQNRIDESNLEIPPAKQKDKKSFEYITNKKLTKCKSNCTGFTA